MRTILSWLCALFFFSHGVGAQSLSYTKADSLFCLQVLDSLKHLQTTDDGERMGKWLVCSWINRMWLLLWKESLKPWW